MDILVQERQGFLQVGVYDLRLHEEVVRNLWIGDRDERTFGMAVCFTAPEGRWVSDNYNVYSSLTDCVVASSINPNELFYSSLRDRLMRFKRATKAVKRRVKMVLYSIALVLLR